MPEALRGYLINPDGMSVGLRGAASSAEVGPLQSLPRGDPQSLQGQFHIAENA
jgi:hypothetical protein